uniref:Transport-associated protein n=1 Tax=Geobacter sp. (strain M21) TaxID=443144 RepID=C6E1C9_GEOSM
MRRKAISIVFCFALAAGLSGTALAGGMAPETRSDENGEKAPMGRGDKGAADKGRAADDEGARAQGESKSDLEITARIRRSIVDHERLSMYAHNVKIYTKNGQVTLKGAVRTKQEKRMVEDLAQKVAGKGKVTNKLLIRPE